MNEHKSNMENTFESILKNARTVLNKQKEYLDELLAESLNVGSASKHETEEYPAILRYKNLIQEVDSLSKALPKLSGIPDIFRRFVKDIDESNVQLQISKSARQMADSVIQRGNSFVFGNVINNIEIIIESLTELFTEIKDFKMPDQQFLEIGLSERDSWINIEETITGSGGSFNEASTCISMMSDSAIKREAVFVLNLIKIRTGHLFDSLKQLSEFTDCMMANHEQFPESDLLKRFKQDRQ